MLMEYSIGKQRSPFGFQSHPKYSRNKHSFPKSVITAKFGSMIDEANSCIKRTKQDDMKFAKESGKAS